MAYIKQTWLPYNPDRPKHQQPNTLISSEKLRHMEDGIQQANKTIKIACVDNNRAENSINTFVLDSMIGIEIIYNNRVNDNVIDRNFTWSSQQIEDNVFKEFGSLLIEFREELGIDLLDSNSLDQFLSNIESQL